MAEKMFFIDSINYENIVLKFNTYAITKYEHILTLYLHYVLDGG